MHVCTHVPYYSIFLLAGACSSRTRTRPSPTSRNGRHSKHVFRSLALAFSLSSSAHGTFVSKVILSVMLCKEACASINCRTSVRYVWIIAVCHRRPRSRSEWRTLWTAPTACGPRSTRRIRRGRLRSWTWLWVCSLCTCPRLCVCRIGALAILLTGTIGRHDHPV